MDPDLLKRHYGRRLCLVGNIDIDHALNNAAPQEVQPVVRRRIEPLAAGGGYLIVDSNSVPHDCRAQDLVAMSGAFQKYRNLY